MPLAPSTRIGAYEIAASIGAGGMGEVYRARDTRLGRDVALKVLPLSRHDDPELLERFEREARLLATLNDSHIAAIYDIVTVGDHRAIVMELVPGEPLTDVIARGPIPARLALRYAIDISHALSVAHAAGIVHRDLKPGNIMITPAGTAKVLDFGVAKLQAGGDGSGRDGRTITANTRPNTALGTPAYMSPEQTHGRPVDARSDIFSFGVVMHEMISGRPAFEGESTAAVLSAILRDDPPSLRAIAPSTPRPVERCVTRCLEKDPARRYQHASDLKAALEDVRDDLETGERPAARDPGAAPAVRRGNGLVKPLTGAAALVIVAAAGFAAGIGLRPAPALRIPKLRPYITEAASARKPVWSPDGRTLAYMAEANGNLHIFLRAASATQSTQLTTQTVRAGILFWSPDGSRLYFSRGTDGTLVSVSAGGGEPAAVPIPGSESQGSRDGTQAVQDACISPDGRTIAFVSRSETGVQLKALDMGSGQVTSIVPQGLPQPSALMYGLEFSPDGDRLALFASTTALSLTRGVWIISWASRSARHVIGDAPYLVTNSRISWMPDGRRLIIAGRPLEGGAARILLADTKTGSVADLTQAKEDEADARVSPDGSRIAFVSTRLGLDLIQFPINGGPPEPVLATSRNEWLPDMSRSGALAYVTDAEGPGTVRLRSASDAWPRTVVGASAVELERGIQPRDIRLSPDGQRVAVSSYAMEHVIWLYPIAGGTPVRLDTRTTDQHGASWSPDGNWIAYRRMLPDGKWELAKAPVGGGAVIRLDETTQGGAPTDWSPAGDWIAYPRPDGVIHLIAPGGSSPRALAGSRTPWFRFSHDGARLFVVRRAATRGWELATWDVATARELRSDPLPLAASASVDGITLSADGSRIILGVGAPTSDIWLLEDFDAPARRRWVPW